MTNSEKIQLLRLRLRALDKETESLELLETTMRLMMSYSQHEARFAEIRGLIDAARAAYNEEIAARTTTGGVFGGYFARKEAVNRLRTSKPGLYGSHKVANVNIEAIRARIDELEALIGYDREDGVMLFNTMAKRWASGTPLPEAAVQPERFESPSVRLGRHIFIKGPLKNITDKDLQAFQLAILRYLRRIVQTEVGRTLLHKLDAGATKFKRRSNPSSDAIVTIRLGDSAKEWMCQCQDYEGAAARGRPTIDTIPKTRGQRQGSSRGTGEGSVAYVYAFPTETIPIGPGKDHQDNAWIPAHVALYHELTHALRGVTGKQDHTFLSEAPRQLGDTFAHRGAWYTREEKETVAAEKEYSEEAGFNLKRVNYGQLGERIDKS